MKEEPREVTLLKAAWMLLNKQKDSFYVLNLLTSSMTEPTVMGIAYLMTFLTICWIKALTRRQKVEYI